MDFGRFNRTCGMGLIVSLTSLGCAESNGYTDYSALPQTAAESVEAEPVAPSVTTQDSTSEPAPEDSTATVESAGEPDLSDVTPGEAVYGEGDQGGGASDAPREIKLLVKDKSFPAIKGSDAIRVGYDDVDLEKILNVINVQEDIVDHFPDWLKQLDGKKIRMRGFMYPTFKAEGLTSFVFTRDTGACCFGPNPYIFLRAKVKLADDEKTDYIHMTPFDVEGTFRIAPLSDDEGLWQLYRIEDARVL